MDEQQQSTFILKPQTRIFRRTPYELFLLNLVIGMCSSLYFPTLSLTFHDKYNWSNFVIIAPSLLCLAGISTSKIILNFTKYKCPVNLHLGLGVFLLASSIIAFGYLEGTDNEKTSLVLVFIVRGIQGFASGYLTTFSNHLLIEDPTREDFRKKCLQFSVVAGILLGYISSVIFQDNELVFYCLAGIIVVSLFLVIFSIKNNKLTQFPIEKNMRISISNIAFRRRTIAALLALFFVNLSPAILDFSLPRMGARMKFNKLSLITMYCLQGAGFLVILSVRGHFYKIFGSRLGILIGLFYLSVAYFTIWPFSQNEPNQTYLYIGLFASGLGLGHVNIFVAADLLATTANFYRINLRYIRNKVLTLFSVTCIFSSATGYLLVAFFFNADKAWKFYHGTFIFFCLSLFGYLALEGWRGFSFPFLKQKEVTDSVINDAQEELSKEQSNQMALSLIQHQNLELQKERFINCNIFLGKYFIGDSYSTSTPFII